MRVVVPALLCERKGDAGVCVQVKPETVATEVEEVATASGERLASAAIMTPETSYGYREGKHKSFSYDGDFQCEIKNSPRGGQNALLTLCLLRALTAVRNAAGVLQGFTLAYETWGELNADKTNTILLHTGLSASSHAKSTPEDPTPGWWEEFIGPGKALNTDHYFVVCANVLGGCFGSTGPSSFVPGKEAERTRYALSFPLITISDIVQTQFKLLDHLGIQQLHASVGSSMGGMQSLAAAAMYPDRVNRVGSSLASLVLAARSNLLCSGRVDLWRTAGPPNCDCVAIHAAARAHVRPTLERGKLLRRSFTFGWPQARASNCND